MPLGSGALAGTTYPLDRQMVADELGFDGITENSLDGVSDRDFAIELASCLSIVMMHLSRFSEEMILWSSHEFKFVEMDDAYSTGSSIMPQKKNPDVAELVRGKTGRVYGNLMALLTVMKSLPLAYNKDMQEDKTAVFEAADIMDVLLPVMEGVISTLKVNPERCRSAIHPAILATDLADYLVARGIPFRSAHEAVGKAVRLAEEKGESLATLPLKDYQTIHPAFAEDLYTALSLEASVNRRSVYGGTALEAVEEQIEVAKKAIG